MEALTDADRSLLRGRNFAHLATLMPDGAPHVTPMWIDVDDEGYVLINTALGRVKVHNMEADARVAISVASTDDPYAWLAVQGRVVEVTREGAAEHIDALAMRYLGTAYEWGTDDRIIFKVRPDHVMRGN